MLWVTDAGLGRAQSYGQDARSAASGGVVREPAVLAIILMLLPFWRAPRSAPPPFDLKSTAWTLTALRLQTTDLAVFADALAARVADAPGLFIADMLKGAAVGGVLGAPFVLAIDFILRNVGEYWWLAGWALYVAFNLVMLLIIPTFVIPLFNKLEPIDDSSLRGRIETLLKRCGFQSKGLFKMDASKRSGHGNAFFTGFGPSKRIVLFDTIIASLSTEEIEAVLAHELGHFKLRHIVKRMLTQLVVSLIGFAAIGWLIAQPWQPPPMLT